VYFRDIIKKLREDFKIPTLKEDADPELWETGAGAGYKVEIYTPQAPKIKICERHGYRIVQSYSGNRDLDLKNVDNLYKSARDAVTREIKI